MPRERGTCVERIKSQDLDGQLRARFTVWLEQLMYHARVNYLKKYYSSPESVGLSQVPEEQLAEEDDYDMDDITEDGFVFEEERLARAYSRLPLMRKRILTLLFVEQLEPAEIAARLHCSVQNVYNQKYRAIKALKEWLGEE